MIDPTHVVQIATERFIDSYEVVAADADEAEAKAIDLFEREYGDLRTFHESTRTVEDYAA